MSLQHNFTAALLKDENLEVRGLLDPPGTQVIHVTIAHGGEVQADYVPPTRLADKEWDLMFNPGATAFAKDDPVLAVGVAVLDDGKQVTWSSELTVAVGG